MVRCLAFNARSASAPLFAVMVAIFPRLLAPRGRFVDVGRPPRVRRAVPDTDRRVRIVGYVTTAGRTAVTSDKPPYIKDAPPRPVVTADRRPPRRRPLEDPSCDGGRPRRARRPGPAGLLRHVHR